LQEVGLFEAIQSITSHYQAVLDSVCEPWFVIDDLLWQLFDLLVLPIHPTPPQSICLTRR
jgi:hypothetical protein